MIKANVCPSEKTRRWSHLIVTEANNNAIVRSFPRQTVGRVLRRMGLMRAGQARVALWSSVAHGG